MTTRWVVPRMWEGQTVAVLGNGQSMSTQLAKSVGHLPRIACRRALRFCLHADVVVALDGDFEADDGFEGMRVVGFEREGLEAMYLALPHERVRLGEGHVVEIRNNGLAAIRLAAMAGASKIILLGFDRGRYGEGAPEGAGGYVGLEEGLDALVAELRAQGVEVERA
jgi:hypothetical protein